MRLVSFRVKPTSDQATEFSHRSAGSSVTGPASVPYGLKTGVLVTDDPVRVLIGSDGAGGHEISNSSENWEVIDLTDSSVGLPGEMNSLLSLGPEGLRRARQAVSSGSTRFGPAEIDILAPVPVPPKFLGIGLNYHDHVAEMGLQPPEYQVWFNKQRTCVVGPGEPIVIPEVSGQVDYEGELGLVIGQRCRNVPRDKAMDVVAGYTVINDVSVRDWQWRTSQFTMGKGFDTHGPTGPWILTMDEAPQFDQIEITTTVNGDVRQRASVQNMIFDCSEMIEHLTSAFTLEPGDLIATGTPAGVGGSFNPPKWLVDSDQVVISIEGVGTLANPVRGPIGKV
ncbi:MAG TPA: fumarylacetoacetate hydrolase family protein [Acidimicrobiales bacterium]|nr:fumarylacetoacetate hydrolase family protein [Acidimicrobiales bacterium]